MPKERIKLAQWFVESQRRGGRVTDNAQKNVVIDSWIPFLISLANAIRLGGSFNRTYDLIKWKLYSIGLRNGE
jgi:hypothetical protein